MQIFNCADQLSITDQLHIGVQSPTVDNNGVIAFSCMKSVCVK